MGIFKSMTAAAAYATQSATATAGAAELEPIAGVSIETFAQVCKGLAAYNYDQSKAPELAAAKGVSAESWQAAMNGSMTLAASFAIARA